MFDIVKILNKESLVFEISREHMLVFIFIDVRTSTFSRSLSTIVTLTSLFLVFSCPGFSWLLLALLELLRENEVL